MRLYGIMNKSAKILFLVDIRESRIKLIKTL